MCFITKYKEGGTNLVSKKIIDNNLIRGSKEVVRDGGREGVSGGM